MTFSRLIKEVFEDYTEFIFYGNVINGYMEADCKLFYIECDEDNNSNLDECHFNEQRSMGSNKSGPTNTPQRGKKENLNRTTLYAGKNALMAPKNASPNFSQSPNPKGRTSVAKQVLKTIEY